MQLLGIPLLRGLATSIMAKYNVVFVLGGPGAGRSEAQLPLLNALPDVLVRFAWANLVRSWLCSASNSTCYRSLISTYHVSHVWSLRVDRLHAAHIPVSSALISYQSAIPVLCAHYLGTCSHHALPPTPSPRRQGDAVRAHRQRVCLSFFLRS